MAYPHLKPTATTWSERREGEHVREGGRRAVAASYATKTMSWACQVTAREVDWSCPAECNNFGSDSVDTTIMHKSNKCLFCPRDMADIKIRKMWKCPKLGWKKKQARLSGCVHMRSKYDVKISNRLSQNWAGLRRIAFFFVRNHLTYTESILVTIFGSISWWVVNLAMKLVSIFFWFILLRTGKIKLETDSYAILFQVI